MSSGKRPSTASAAGLAGQFRYPLPMPQEQLADATGLTPVHANRILRGLERHPDFRLAQLRAAVGFSEAYLHLDQAAAA